VCPVYLLAAVNTVQSLLQLSEGVAFQTLGPFLRDGGEGLAQQALGGLGQRAGRRMGIALGLGLSAEPRVRRRWGVNSCHNTTSKSGQAQSLAAVEIIDCVLKYMMHNSSEHTLS